MDRRYHHDIVNNCQKRTCMFIIYQEKHLLQIFTNKLILVTLEFFTLAVLCFFLFTSFVRFVMGGWLLFQVYN